jgi:hypothetical protein
MKLIARNLNLIGLLLLASFATAAAALYFHVPQPIPTARARTDAPARYVCPMHPNIASASPADCAECGMKLVAIGDEKVGATPRVHKDGCCGEKPVAVEPSPAATCPHLAAQAASTAPVARADSCCPKPAHP